MQLSSKGAAFVRAHEGFVSRYYLDPVKVPTIGIGFTWRSSAFRDWWTKNKPGIAFGPGVTMSRIEAENALRYLFDREYGKAVNNFLDKAVPQHVFDGMASPVYNLGPGSLKWKWAAAAKAGDYARAASLLRTTGTTAKGRTLAGLVRRRKEEALLLEKGIYTGVGAETKATGPVDPMADGVLARRESGPAVAQLIRDLHALGYYDGRLDDVFGPGTEAAVMEFQRRNGLTVDGIAGPVTLKAIAAALASSSKPVEPPKPVPPVIAATPSPEPRPAPAQGGLWALFASILKKLAGG